MRLARVRCRFQIWPGSTRPPTRNSVIPSTPRGRPPVLTTIILIALLVLVNMLFAFFLAHLGQLGMLNEAGGWQLELQGMYLASSLALALLGPGRYSVNGR